MPDNGNGHGLLLDFAVTHFHEPAAKQPNGAEILNRVSDFIRRYVHLSDPQARTVAVWTAHTHAASSATTTPYLNIHSAVKQSGKTRLLEVLELPVNQPWLTGRVTAACLIRKVDQVRPTLDYEHASWSADHLTDFLQTLKTPQVDLKHLQLIAHSMGARVLGQAVKGLERNNSKRMFDNVILAAADVDEDTFDQFSPALKHSADRITSYVSTWDWALAWSRRLHKSYRVGMLSVGRDGIDVIDTLGLEASLRQFNHSYIFESQLVLNDLFSLIRNGSPPNSRVSLVPTQDKCCWQFEKR